MKVIHWIALILVVVGALNWGMIGFFKIDVIGSIFGGQNAVGARVIYALVGLAGLWSLQFFRWLCCCCDYKHYQDYKSSCHTCTGAHTKERTNGDRTNGGTNH